MGKSRKKKRSLQKKEKQTKSKEFVFLADDFGFGAWPVPGLADSKPQAGWGNFCSVEGWLY